MDNDSDTTRHYLLWCQTGLGISRLLDPAFGLSVPAVG